MDRKLLSGIKSMYADSVACVIVKWGECEWLMIVGCTMFTWLFNKYMDAVVKEVKMGV